MFTIQPTLLNPGQIVRAYRSGPGCRLLRAGGGAVSERVIVCRLSHGG
jgi:hypothetical protein